MTPAASEAWSLRGRIQTSSVNLFMLAKISSLCRVAGLSFMASTLGPNDSRVGAVPNQGNAETAQFWRRLDDLPFILGNGNVTSH